MDSTGEHIKARKDGGCVGLRLDMCPDGGQGLDELREFFDRTRQKLGLREVFAHLHDFLTVRAPRDTQQAQGTLCRLLIAEHGGCVELGGPTLQEVVMLTLAHGISFLSSE